MEIDIHPPSSAAKYRRDYYHQNKDHILSLMRERYKNNPIPVLISEAKRRAKKKGIAFDISPNDLEMPGVCPILGMRLAPNVGGSSHKPNSPTIDRIDPTKGYVRGNVWIISHRANQIKTDATPSELFLVAEAVAAIIETLPESGG